MFCPPPETPLPPGVVGQRENDPVLVPPIKAGDDVGSEPKRIELPVQARIARRDAHERHLTPDYLKRISVNRVQHKSTEPARRGRRRAHLNRPRLRLPVVIDDTADQLAVSIDDTNGAAIAEAALVAEQELRDEVRDCLVMTVEDQTTKAPCSKVTSRLINSASGAKI
jgi:hypothetical protein